MIFAALLLSVAAPGAPPVQTIFDGAVDIARGQVRSLAIPVQAAPRRVACSWAVHRGAPVRLLLMPAGEVDAWVRGKPHTLAAAAGYGRSGHLSYVAAGPAELVLVVEPQGAAPELTRLRLTARLMDPSLPFPPPAAPADRTRGAILAWGSLGLFAAAAGFSASRIRRNFRRRWGG